MSASFVPYRYTARGVDAMRQAGKDFWLQMQGRRSIRDFSVDPVPRELIEYALHTAATAPSGANQQPWKFVAVSDPAIKREIRIAAEQEEYESYEGGRMSEEWLEALQPIGTTWQKPFLEIAPWIVVVFEEVHGMKADGSPLKHYYAKESVGIACGLLIAAIHEIGLVTLTHTPSPMGFLNQILQRPAHERPFILFPIGYPAKDAQVPNLQRKSFDETVEWIE